MEHTPGPWEVRPYEYRKRGQSYTRPAAVIANDKDGVARAWIAPEICGHDLKGSSLANALLIAAAPELLEALKAWIDHRSAVFHAQMMGTIEKIPSGRVDEIVAQAKAAIAKAEGR